ncbi:MAG: phosphotransferase, partial [Gammaproteobacteria bacterium]|nr:phosphotransferase [Gammaproteobacteria bacterium]
MDKRLNALRTWLQDTLDDRGIALTPASEDASFRRYFRFNHGQQTLIAMDAPPEHEDIQAFMAVAHRLLGLGLNVPVVMAADPDRGFLLTTDLGSATYLDHLNPVTADRLYGDALGALVVLQTGTFSDGPRFPAYDRGALLTEMELFREWYIPRYAGAQLSARDHRMLDGTFGLLADSALEQPQVLVHRDYHSRNLMVCTDHNPGILDFQDAVTGAMTYDLVSLLKDC